MDETINKIFTNFLANFVKIESKFSILIPWFSLVVDALLFLVESDSGDEGVFIEFSVLEVAFDELSLLTSSSDVHRWLEALMFSLMASPEDELRKIVDIQSFGDEGDGVFVVEISIPVFTEFVKNLIL